LMVGGADDLREHVAAELTELLAYDGPLSPSGARSTVMAPQNFRRGAVTPARRELWRELRGRYLARQPNVVMEGRAALLTAGVPGAGKSRAVERLGVVDEGWRRLDADVVKDYLIEDLVAAGRHEDLLGELLADGYPIMPAELATLVHEESVVFDGTGPGVDDAAAARGAPARHGAGGVGLRRAAIGGATRPAFLPQLGTAEAVVAERATITVTAAAAFAAEHVVVSRSPERLARLIGFTPPPPVPDQRQAGPRLSVGLCGDGVARAHTADGGDGQGRNMPVDEVGVVPPPTDPARQRGTHCGHLGDDRGGRVTDWAA